MRIIVNGEEHQWQKRTISYNEVAELAYPGKGYKELTMTYHWRGPGDLERNGILWPSKSPIDTAEGMTFCAVHTGNA